LVLKTLTFGTSRQKSKKARLAYGLLIAAFQIIGGAKAQLVNFNPNNPANSGYTIAFDDEFEGPVLNLSKWNTGWAWNNGLGTNISTYPHDEALPENITLSEGVANFAITRGPTPHGLPYGTSVANTWGKFNQTYGYWEIRLEMPNNAAGAWPAFWLVPETFAWPPEIDIMEWLGNLSTTDFMTLHYTQNGAMKQSGASSQVLNFNTAFHQLGLLWTPTSVTWYIDGLQVAQSTSGIPSQPMYMILNIDTGGWSGNAIGLTTVFPIQLKVDYVRVWSAPR